MTEPAESMSESMSGRVPSMVDDQGSGATDGPTATANRSSKMTTIVESAFRAAKNKISEIEPNDVLKMLGLQVIRSSGGLFFRLPMLAAFSGGLAIGAGTALLFAPAKGAENRKALVAWTKNAFANLKTGATKAIEGAKDVAEDAGEAVDEGVSGAKKKANHKVKAQAEA